MKRKQSNPKQSKIDVTPLIDVVFLLLSFFIMTFRIIAPEGDFNLRMPPLGTPTTSEAPEPIRVKLAATASGGLSQISFGDRPLGNDFRVLRRTVLGYVWDRGGPDKADVEIELNPDPHLRWEFVMEAITAVTGRMGENRQIEKICEKVKFAPRSRRE